MKRILVVTLALVLVFAGSAMAAVSFSGKFETVFKQNDFKLFASDDYSLTPTLSFNVKASNKSETGDYLNWEFNVDSDKDFAFKKYRLGLYDNYFNAYIWGNGWELSDKATHFGLISAPKKESASARVRLEVPVQDLATVTADVGRDALRLFVDANVEGYALGLAYQRTDWAADEPKNVIAAQVGGNIPAGDLDLGFKAAVGVSLGEDMGLAFGAGVDADVTDELGVGVDVKHANGYWAGGGPAKDNTVVHADATYTEKDYQVTADVTHTMVKDDDGSTVIELGGKYRMSNKLSYGDLFHKDHWFKNDAPAFGVSVTVKGSEDYSFGLDASSPVVDGLAWVKANAGYAGKDTLEAKVLGHVVATDKLTVKPAVEFKSADSAVNVEVAADYKIGFSDTTVSLLVKKGFVKDDDGTELIQVSVSVPF